MGHDEDKNNFDTNGAPATPVTPNPLATFTSGNRLGMRQSRNISAAQAELDRISADSNPNAPTGRDIVLNNGGTGGGINKKAIILGALVVIAIIVAVLSVILTKGKVISGIFSDKFEEAYNNYVEYLLNGEVGENKDDLVTLSKVKESGDLIYPLAFSTTSNLSHSTNAEVEKYFEELNKRFAEVEKNVKSDKKAIIDNNKELLVLLDKTVNYTKYTSELINAYGGNVENARKYLTDNFSYNGDDIEIKTFVENQQEFYESYISEYIIYSTAGCYKNAIYNFDCLLATGNVQAADNAISAGSMVSSSFNKMTSSSMLKALNTKIINLTSSMGGK